MVNIVYHRQPNLSIGFGKFEEIFGNAATVDEYTSSKKGKIGCGELYKPMPIDERADKYGDFYESKMEIIGENHEEKMVKLLDKFSSMLYNNHG